MRWAFSSQSFGVVLRWTPPPGTKPARNGSEFLPAESPRERHVESRGSASPRVHSHCWVVLVSLAFGEPIGGKCASLKCWLSRGPAKHSQVNPVLELLLAHQGSHFKCNCYSYGRVCVTQAFERLITYLFVNRAAWIIPTLHWALPFLKIHLQGKARQKWWKHWFLLLMAPSTLPKELTNTDGAWGIGTTCQGKQLPL